VHQFYVHIVMIVVELVNISKSDTSNQLSICVKNEGKKRRLDLNYINKANIMSTEEMQLISKRKKEWQRLE
jgi:hypothetical protein